MANGDGDTIVGYSRSKAKKQFVDTSGSGVGIKWGTLLSTVFGAVVVFLGSLWAAVGGTLGRFINWLLASAGGWYAGFQRTILNRSANLLSGAWTVAGQRLARRFGVFAPWVAVGIALAFITLAGFGVRMWYRE